MSPFSLLIPEMIVLGMLCVILLVDMFLSDRARVITYWLTQGTIIAAAIVTLCQWSKPFEIGFHGMVVHDQLGSVLMLFIELVMLFALVYSRSYNKRHAWLVGEFYVLALASLLGMLVMVSAHNFITIYLGVELLSLPLYAMVAMRKDSDVAPEAAMKYFVTGAMASGMLLYGLSLLYGMGRSLDIAVVAHALSSQIGSLPVLLGMCLVVVGLLFKLGAAPFHMWVPDVYHGAPVSVTAIISSAPKIAAFGIALRLLAGTLGSESHAWNQLLVVVAVLSMGLGNLLAMTQANIKRMFGYSAVAHAGYLLLGLLTATSLGYAASLMYVISYAFMAVCGFGLLSVLGREGIDIERIEDLRGLNARSPWLAFLFLILLFSMAGIPPTLGFFAKIGVIDALVQAHYVWLACIAMLFAVMGAYYYLRVVKAMYFDEPTTLTVIQPSLDAHVAIGVNALALLILGLFPSGFIALTQSLSFAV